MRKIQRVKSKHPEVPADADDYTKKIYEDARELRNKWLPEKPEKQKPKDSVEHSSDFAELH